MIWWDLKGRNHDDKTSSGKDPWQQNASVQPSTSLCPHAGLNHGPQVYKTCALPLSYTGSIVATCRSFLVHFGVSMLSTKLPCQLSFLPPPARLFWEKRLQARSLVTTDLAFKRGLGAKGAVNHADTANAYTVTEAKSHARPAQADTDTTSEQTASHAPNVAILDKLIAVFASKSPTEWRKLIAHSKQWPELSVSVLARIDQQRQAEEDLEKKASLRKLHRQLESVHTELQEHGETLEVFQNAEAADWEGLVAEERLQLTAEFFDHVENLIHAAHQNETQREELITLTSRLIALVQAFDAVTADQEALALASDKFQDLLKVDSLQEMDAKIDSMARSGALDPALLLTLAKAHTSVKDTDYTREEVKDVMAHLYFKAKETLEQQQLPEVRILKQLLRIQSPQERRTALFDAFEPAKGEASAEQDMLSTTPEDLLQTIEAVLKAYEAQAGSRRMVADAASLMNPEVIQTMRELQKQIRKGFM
ncbi:hypothetical protein ABBQ32_011024 [Trebouxia sp. C0010 RCD-2024]